MNADTRSEIEIMKPVMIRLINTITGKSSKAEIKFVQFQLDRNFLSSEWARPILYQITKATWARKSAEKQQLIDTAMEMVKAL